MGADNASMPADRKVHEFPQPDDVFQIKITLADASPEIWRRLLLPQSIDLRQVHRCIQAAMGWSDAHMHAFRVAQVTFGEPDGEGEPDPIDERLVALNHVFNEVGDLVSYEYDFGDSWTHELLLERRIRSQDVKEKRLPSCVGGGGACPPEDIGGIHGYVLAVRAFKHRVQDDRDGPPALPDGFDPEAFDLDLANARLGPAISNPKPRFRGGRPRQA